MHANLDSYHVSLLQNSCVQFSGGNLRHAPQRLISHLEHFRTIVVSTLVMWSYNLCINSHEIVSNSE